MRTKSETLKKRTVTQGSQKELRENEEGLCRHPEKERLKGKMSFLMKEEACSINCAFEIWTSFLKAIIALIQVRIEPERNQPSKTNKGDVQRTGKMHINRSQDLSYRQFIGLPLRTSLLKRNINTFRKIRGIARQMAQPKLERPLKLQTSKYNGSDNRDKLYTYQSPY